MKFLLVLIVFLQIVVFTGDKQIVLNETTQNTFENLLVAEIPLKITENYIFFENNNFDKKQKTEILKENHDKI